MTELGIMISQLLQEYQEKTHKTWTQIALEIDATISNVYLYRCGMGNPTAKTFHKIAKMVERDCPGLLEKHFHSYVIRLRDSLSSEEPEKVLAGIV